MSTGTIVVTNSGTNPTATLLIAAGDGQTLIQNTSLINTLYIGDTDAIQWNDPSTVTPVAPNGYFALNGEADLFGVTAPGQTVSVAVVAGGTAAFLGITQAQGALNVPSLRIYDPSPGPNNLVTSISDENLAIFNDPYGDEVLPGITAYRRGVEAINIKSESINFYNWNGSAWQGAAAISFLDSAINVAGDTFLPPSGDVTGVTDTANIVAILTLGFSLRLVAGVYYTNATIQLNVSGTTIRGIKGNTLSLTAYGTVIRATGGTFTGTSIFGISATSEEQYISDLTINLAFGPSGVHGIEQTGGSVNNVRIHNVNIIKAPGSGLIQSGGSAAAWDVRGLVVHRAGSHGIDFSATDSMWDMCYIIGSGQITGSDGWVIGTASNSIYNGCRVEDTLGGKGFSITSQNKAGNGVWFNGCSTQGNAFDGFSVTATTGSASPVHFTNCNANEDGVNAGAGGGGYGGFAFRSCSAGNPVYSLAGCMTTVNTQFTPGGAPQYGLVSAVAASNHIRAVGCLLWGLTAGVNTDGTAAVLDTTLSTTGVGLPATPATFTN